MPPWVETLLWIAAAVSAVWVIWTKGIVPMVKVFKAASRTWDEVQRMAPVLRDIAEEFKPNDGTSLRDRVDLIGVTVNENQRALEDRILTHDTYHESLEYRIAKLEK